MTILVQDVFAFLLLTCTYRSYATESVENQGHILEHLNRSQLENKQLHQKVDKLLSTSEQGLGSSAIDYIISRVGSHARDNLEESLQGAVFAGAAGEADIVNGIRTSDFVVDPSRKRKLEAAFISALQYDGMLDRQSTVAEAHQATFRWVFVEDAVHRFQWTNLVTWLRSPDQLYWVTGKAGSGKSTLMKYVTQPAAHLDSINSIDSGDSSCTTQEPEARCFEYLRSWAGDKPLVMASFYFWAAGSKIQTSKAGMYRTLLHQLLSTQPGLLPLMSPSRWEALCLFGRDVKPLNEDELREMLQSTLTEMASTAAVCLFIDGLDEFEGKHDDLILFLKHLVENTPVKLCVASRPWQVFEDAFQNKPSLRLEDLTYQDIKDFVTSRFQSDSNFSQLESREADFAGQLVEKVVQKASGVFLWVHLVVSSLLDGMKFGDRVIDLRRRLDTLPPDLEELYAKILSDLDPFYFEHAAQYFQIMKCSFDPPPALLLSFADEPDIDFVLKLPLQAISSEDAWIRVETMRRRVNSRCKGLIEVVRPNSESKDILRIPIQYLHKTVKDYIEGPDVQAKLLHAVNSQFDPNLSLCAGALAMFKITGGEAVDLIQCLRFGSHVSLHRVPDMIRLLDDAETSISGMDYADKKNCFDLLMLYMPQNVRGRIDLPVHRIHAYAGVASFISLATRWNIVEYVRTKVPAGCLVTKSEPSNEKTKRSSLDRASWGKFKTIAKKIANTSRHIPFAWPLLIDALPRFSAATDTSMITMLLNKGADPNYEFRLPEEPCMVSTAWTYTLAVVLGVFSTTSWDPERKGLWEDITRLMLAHGARIDRRTIDLVMDVLKHSFGLDPQGIDRRAMVNMTQGVLRRMKDNGVGLDFPLGYDLRSPFMTKGQRKGRHLGF